MIAIQPRTNQQGRLVLAPEDGAGKPVTLDPNALSVTVADNGLGGTFELNGPTNGLVFRPPDTVPPTNADGTPPSTRYHVDVDGQPGPGETFLGFDVEMTALPVSAVSAGESVVFEDKGTPA